MMDGVWIDGELHAEWLDGSTSITPLRQVLTLGLVALGIDAAAARELAYDCELAKRDQAKG